MIYRNNSRTSDYTKSRSFVYNHYLCAMINVHALGHNAVKDYNIQFIKKKTKLRNASAEYN